MQRNLYKLGILLLLMMILGASAVGTKGVREQSQSLETSIEFAVMQGPSGFSSAGLRRNEGLIADAVRVNLSVFPSPNEVIARLANGELDAAALPTNVAANLYNKGVPLKLVAVVGEGMLYMVSTDQSILELDDLAGRIIHIPGSGSTPDQITRILIASLGYDPETDLRLDSSIASPAQLAQLLIAGKVDIAVLPEPFVSMTYAGRQDLRILINLQEVWSMITGSMNYPMTVVVVSKKFTEENPQAFEALMGAIKNSVEWVNANPQDAGDLIESAGIMKASVASPAIATSNLVFKTVGEARDSLEDYYKILFGYDYLSIGSALPDEAFYLAY